MPTPILISILHFPFLHRFHTYLNESFNAQRTGRAYELRCLYNRKMGINKAHHAKAKQAQGEGPEAPGPWSNAVLVSDARERVAKLNELEQAWVAHLKQFFPKSTEPKPVPLLPYSPDHKNHRQVVKAFRTNHMRSWEKSEVGQPAPLVIPEEVSKCLALLSHSHIDFTGAKDFPCVQRAHASG